VALFRGTRFSKPPNPYDVNLPPNNRDEPTFVPRRFLFGEFAPHPDYHDEPALPL